MCSLFPGSRQPWCVPVGARPLRTQKEKVVPQTEPRSRPTCISRLDHQWDSAGTSGPRHLNRDSELTKRRRRSPVVVFSQAAAHFRLLHLETIHQSQLSISFSCIALDTALVQNSSKSLNSPSLHLDTDRVERISVPACCTAGCHAPAPSCCSWIQEGGIVDSCRSKIDVSLPVHCRLTTRASS